MPSSSLPRDAASPPSERIGDVVAALLIVMVVLVTNLPAACEEKGVFIPRFEPLVLDPNTATDADLQTLPGVGRVLAGRIAAERGRAPFLSAEDLLRVHGIGPKLMVRARPHVRIPVADSESEAAEETPR